MPEVVRVPDPLERLQQALADRYRVERELGAGGMATVYLAQDLKHDRPVALKVLREELGAALGAERFHREIRIAAKLQHPNILPLLDSGEAGGLLYFAMPFVEGQSLRERLAREGALPAGDAVRILRDVADALTEAHAHGVVHRDIKPENIMLRGRHALVTDFGVAKAVSAAAGSQTLTTAGVALGTPAYMAPEQATADPQQDHRVDIYAVGVLGYELLTGRGPFAATTAQEMLAAHITAEPEPLAKRRPGVAPALEQVVMKCLAKKPADRWQTADELLEHLEPLATPSGGVTPIGTAAARALAVVGRPRRAAVIGGALLVAAVALLWLGLHHRARVTWAREIAIPQIRQLADSGRVEPAYKLALQVDRIIPGDSTLGILWTRITRRVNIRTRPAGARVYRRAYLDDDSAWQYLGTTPLDSIRWPLVARDLSRVRFERAGFATLEVAAVPTDSPYVLNDGKAVPLGMVQVPGGSQDELYLSGLERIGEFTVGSYFMDVHEVTNRQYREFVDSGGYRRQEFWDQPFLEGGKPLAWETAMARFVDRTGRQGPATWEAGDYPPGQAEYPVGGVSWYEAMAYAKFAHRSLPTILHWARAAATYLSAYTVPRSNLAGKGPARVGSLGGVGRYGTYDMAGNAREWCLNGAANDERYILGGGWNDPTYAFNDAYAQSPFDRSPTNGLRLVQYLRGDTTLAAASRPAVREHRDFSKERPVSNAIYQVYRRLYDYDRTPLRAVIEQSDSSAEDWVLQRITFDAAYGNDRVTTYLFLPKRGHPPYQTIVYFPGSNAIHDRSFLTSMQTGVFNFILKSGRAVLYPIYKGTYERGDGLNTDYPSETNFYKDHVIMWAKDLRRSIDYAATRADLDATRLAYYGVSWGGYLGGLMPAIEPRFKAVVLLVAGLEQERGDPEVEPINFLPHITVPVLMLNGRYDYYFPVESAQLPFFRLLGTPPQHKRQVISEGSHFVPFTQVIAETLGWLDRYLGTVH
jgi:dienelactone hydrolase